jgi:hypothetical protein
MKMETMSWSRYAVTGGAGTAGFWAEAVWETWESPSDADALEVARGRYRDEEYCLFRTDGPEPILIEHHPATGKANDDDRP